MRTLWRDEIASYTSEFVSFDAIRVNPKPDQPTIPVMLGGNSDPALRRVAEWGDGWYGFGLDGVGAAAERLDTLTRLCEEAGRDRGELVIAVALRSPTAADRQALADLGVDELVLVESPPETGVEAWVDQLADQWLDRQRPE